MNATYSRYLASSEWRRKRDRAMKRAGKVCEMCGQRPPTQVHHIRYPKRLGDEPLTDLLAVCRQCHEKGHGMIERQRTAMTFTFEGRDIAAKVESDDEPLFLWSDVERAVFKDDRSLLLGAANSRQSMKRNMRAERHFDVRAGDDYLTHAGIVRWAQILPRLQSTPNDNILWRFSDWVEDLVNSIRTGKIAIVNVSGAPVQEHPDLMQAIQAVQSLTAHAQKETKRIDHIYSSIPALGDDETFITAREGCVELAKDPDQIVKGRMNLETVVGRCLTETGQATGGKVDHRLSGSSVVTTVNTYRRCDVHDAIREIGRGEVPK